MKNAQNINAATNSRTNAFRTIATQEFSIGTTRADFMTRLHSPPKASVERK